MGPTYPHPTPMPADYELMEAYRTWWRASFGTTPNSQTVIIAAAWASYVLATYRDGANDQAGDPVK